MTQQQRTPAVGTCMQMDQFANEISVQNNTYNRFPVPNNIDNISTSKTIFASAIRQVTRQYEQTQEPLLIFFQLKILFSCFSKSVKHSWSESSTAQNQSEVQFLSTTRDNISSKQTAPVLVRPKTKIQEPQNDSEEIDINVQSLKEQVCQIQTQNVQKSAMITEKKTITALFATTSSRKPMQKLHWQQRCPTF